MLSGYVKRRNVTMDFYNIIIFQGNMSASLIGMFGKK